MPVVGEQYMTVNHFTKPSQNSDLNTSLQKLLQELPNEYPPNSSTKQNTLQY